MFTDKCLEAPRLVRAPCHRTSRSLPAGGCPRPPAPAPAAPARTPQPPQGRRAASCSSSSERSAGHPLLPPHPASLLPSSCRMAVWHRVNILQMLSHDAHARVLPAAAWLRVGGAASTSSIMAPAQSGRKQGQRRRFPLSLNAPNDDPPLDVYQSNK